MWFVDVVIDIDWFSAQDGHLGVPKSSARQAIPGQSFDNTFLLYGDDYVIRHLRVLLHTDVTEPPHAVMDANIHRWVSLLEVASGLGAPRTATTASLGPGRPGMITLLSQGGADAVTASVIPTFEPPQPIDYGSLADSMAVWQPDYSPHLFYFSRFLNLELPLEVRWLNGYRVLEWHFCRGSGSLSKNRDFRDFLAQHGEALDELLGPRQERRGLLEEVRATVAHAILSKGPDPRLSNPGFSMITSSMGALEVLVIAVMNQGTNGQAQCFRRADLQQPGPSDETDSSAPDA